MDHKAFEDTMIECVNHNSSRADKAKLEAYIAAKERENASRRRKKSDAAVQIVVWITAYLAFVLCMAYIAWFELVPGWFPSIICAFSGMAVGFKLNALWRAFRK